MIYKTMQAGTKWKELCERFKNIDKNWGPPNRIEVETEATTGNTWRRRGSKPLAKLTRGPSKPKSNLDNLEV